MSLTVKDICDVFFNLEEKYSLNFLEIQGCYPWQLIRMFLYYDIARKTKVFGTAQQQTLSIFDKIKSFTPFIKNSLFSNPFKGNHQCDVLIFDHPRKTIFQGEYKDIYSYFLVDYLKGKVSFEVMEAPYLNKHYSKKQDYVKYTDRIELGSYRYKKFNKISFNDSEKEIISKIQDELIKTFDISLDLFTIIQNHILNFKYDYMKYKELFLKRKPKLIFVVVAYENQAIVAAGKDLGIEVIELQHGTISNYHLGYSYPLKTRSLNGESQDIAYFPNKILTFGDYWINEEVCPLNSRDIIPVGFPYFQHQSKGFINLKKDSKKILFISQGVIGKYLSKFAYEIANRLPDYEIIYKLHPGEYATWKLNYGCLNKANEFKNFTIIDNSEIPLYKLFGESSYQIGAFSTAIYEGLMFNCKTFIVDVPGIEYLDDLIDKGYVYKVKGYDDFVNNFNSFEPKFYNKDFFFKDFDKKLLDDLVE